ncbi:MAG: adenylosuccinate lyase [Flavobacteriaceae bacterium]|nr:adenylosuccinate lyase [Flavobacteriaceae bacterium]
MTLNKLNAISPIDGRYNSKTRELKSFFSEESLIKYRVKIEIEYFIALCKIPLAELEGIHDKDFTKLRSIYIDFSTKDAEKIKEIEKKTNHDVKAVEYFIKEKFQQMKLNKYKEFIHFALTSQDINNTAIPLLIKDALKKVYIPYLEKVIDCINLISKENQDISMLAKTHGQPASPTRLGKELDVFVERIKIQKESLLKVPHAAKLGGANGNFNAHHVTYPKVKWQNFAKNFVENNLGLKYSYPTTQIEHYDSIASLFDNLKRINTILIDFTQDIWSYISMEYFNQKVNTKEVGSSTMPHKINPIDFENAEGNFGIANAMFSFFGSKLPISRLQRDLTDSTVLRNVGIPFGHTLIGFKSVINGLNKLTVNKQKIEFDLNQNWIVVAEAIQTILRREKYSEPYEKLKTLTRNNDLIDKNKIHDFINKLEIREEVKIELKKITPHNYTGI